MRKKILFCMQNFDIGGPQKSLLALLHEFDYKKFDVDLMIWSRKGSLIKFLPSNVNIIDIPDELAYIRISEEMLRKKSYSLIRHGRSKLVIRVLKYVIIGKKLGNMNIARQRFWTKYNHTFDKIKKEYDIAIAFSGGNLCYFIVDCVNAKKRVTWVHSDYRVLHRDKLIDCFYFNFVDKIVTISHMCKDILIDEFPRHISKMNVIYNMLPLNMYEKLETDTSNMPLNHNETILLTVCRIDRFKGLDIAIDAMRLLKKDGCKVKWYVLGDGPHKKEIQGLIIKYGLESEFILLGFTNNPYAYIKKCNIFVHPSRFEGKSVAIDEAKNALKPIVATNFPTVYEQISHLNNGYITKMDGSSLCSGIQELLKNKTLISKLKYNLLIEKEKNIHDLEKFYQLINS